MSEMYKDSKVKEIDLSNFDTSRTAFTISMFENSIADKIVLTGLNMNSLYNASRMFADSKVTTVDLSGFNAPNLENSTYMFYNSVIADINLSNLIANYLSDTVGMFENSKASKIDLSRLNMGHNIFSDDMFKDCTATTGYARTVEDANKLNATSDKPPGLVFSVK